MIQMKNSLSARVASSSDIINRKSSTDYHREASTLLDLVEGPIGPLLRMFFILHDTTSTSNDVLIKLLNSLGLSSYGDSDADPYPLAILLSDPFQSPYLS